MKALAGLLLLGVVVVVQGQLDPLTALQTLRGLPILQGLFGPSRAACASAGFYNVDAGPPRTDATPPILGEDTAGSSRASEQDCIKNGFYDPNRGAEGNPKELDIFSVLGGG